jgi:hypothetical protein
MQFNQIRTNFGGVLKIQLRCTSGDDIFLFQKSLTIGNRGENAPLGGGKRIIFALGGGTIEEQLFPHEIRGRGNRWDKGSSG